ncbi:MAG: hypothetical protein ABJO09_00850 [Hyphomicrobiales bacterium]
MIIVDTNVADVVSRDVWRSLGDAAANVCIEIARRRLFGHTFFMSSYSVDDCGVITIEVLANARH